MGKLNDKYYREDGTPIIRKVAIDFRVNYAELYRKVKQKGCTVEEALGIDEMPDHMKSMTQLAKERGLTYKIVAHRMSKGMSFEEALEKPRRNMIHRTYNGKSLLKYCKEAGLPYQTIYHRVVRRGHSLEEALQHVDGHMPYKKSTYTYKGETKDLKYFSRKYGMNHTTLHKRIKYYGASIEEAIETPPYSGRFTRGGYKKND